MLECFYPDEYLNSAYEVDYEGLYQKGFRGVIFDIDNTLVPHGAPADERSIALFERLRRIGLESVLLSNNKEPRVKTFNDKVHSRYLFKAGKPGGGEDGPRRNCLCGGSAFYGCVGRKEGRNFDLSGQTNPSQGGDSDCLKKAVGVDRIVFLQALSEKAEQKAKWREIG